jgi:hypothetical protein
MCECFRRRFVVYPAITLATVAVAFAFKDKLSQQINRLLGK